MTPDPTERHGVCTCWRIWDGRADSYVKRDPNCPIHGSVSEQPESHGFNWTEEGEKATAYLDGSVSDPPEAASEPRVQHYAPGVAADLGHPEADDPPPEAASREAVTRWRFRKDPVTKSGKPGPWNYNDLGISPTPETPDEFEVETFYPASTLTGLAEELEAGKIDGPKTDFYRGRDAGLDKAAALIRSKAKGESDG